MAVILRLARRGTKHCPYHHIVAADSRMRRNGRYLELVGRYNPLNPSDLFVDAEKAKHWLSVGADQSPAVKKLLRRAGVTQ
jgi:small subunit ribosomal protein S16